jgi:hypothetical protein
VKTVDIEHLITSLRSIQKANPAITSLVFDGIGIDLDLAQVTPGSIDDGRTPVAVIELVAEEYSVDL